jgi:hypothetical protein
VVTTADTMQQRIRQGPAQVQSVLLNLQKRLDEQRLMSALKVRNNSTTLLHPELWRDDVAAEELVSSGRANVALTSPGLCARRLHDIVTRTHLFRPYDIALSGSSCAGGSS